MRGRKPKPTALRLMDGNPGHRPVNEDEPKPDIGLPEPPAHLNDVAKAKWHELAADVSWFARVDADVVAVYCMAYSRWVHAEERLTKTGAVLKAADRTRKTKGKGGKEQTEVVEVGGFYQNPWLAVANKAMEQLQKIGATLGLNPSDRTRLKTPAPSGDDDDLDRFIREAK